LRLYFNDGNEIIKIDYINQFGERRLFTLSIPDQNQNLQENVLDEIYNYIRGELAEYNIYEFLFPKLESNICRVNFDELRKFITEIKTNTTESSIHNNKKKDMNERNKEIKLHQVSLYNRLTVEIQDIDAMQILEI